MPRESVAIKKRRVEEILRRLRLAYPEAKISLTYGNHFQLLVAVILSAQCTDVMVNRVTKTLFRRYRTVEDFARADLRRLETEIRSTGYYRAKARNIRAAARMTLERFDGRVPSTMEELVELPGVGRKTANVVLWNAFGKREGIAVDTHVDRITRLLGLSRARTPQRAEQELLPIVPREAWGEFTHLFIEHGRAVCVARRPRCERCVLNGLCPSALRPADPDLVGTASARVTNASPRYAPPR